MGTGRVRNNKWLKICSDSVRLTLINKACKPADPAECAIKETLVAAFPLVSMELLFAISVEKVLAGYMAITRWEGWLCSCQKSAGEKLWVCQFLDIFVIQSHFDGFVRSLDNVSATQLSGIGFQLVLVGYALCQVSIIVFVHIELVLFLF